VLCASPKFSVRRALSSLLLLLAGLVALTSLGCGSDQVDEPQADSGVGTSDEQERPDQRESGASRSGGEGSGIKSESAESSNFRKVALLVGVNRYEKRGFADKPLQFAERDVEAMAAELTKQGFEVRLLKGSSSGSSRATKSGIDAALTQVLAGRNARDIVFVGFAGHGQQMPLLDDNGGEIKGLDGQPLEDAFFCPVDSVQKKPSSMISLTGLMRRLNDEGGINLVMVDACRDNPDPGRGRSITGNELNGRLPANTAIVFSCAAGQQAFETDKAGGGHGVFFHHVLEGLQGEAAGRNGTVTWSRLVTYVTENVNHQAKAWFPDRAQALAARSRSTVATVALQTPHELKNLIAIPVLARITAPRPVPMRKSPGTVPKPIPMPKPPDGKALLSNSIGMKLKLIPAGEFQMGSPLGEADRGHDERQHRVRISQPFYMQTTEVTQGQWESVMGTTPWSGEKYVKEGSDYAASYVSWDDAVEFCRKLSLKDGVEYRLPSEAEWEYACRGGSSTAYSFGDNPSALGDYAWFDDNADDIGEEYAHRVGQKRSNGFGLYDMHGNVYEWCSDWYGGDYYKSSPLADPRGPSEGSDRVNRGGSWGNTARYARSASRNRNSPGLRYLNLGFRVLRSSVLK
jgi:formylglycine-generating enzyme required for sulfatase activity